MADTNTTDVRTMTAAEAAEDAELWRQVERGEVEVTFVDGNNTWHVTYAVIHTGDWLLHSFHQWVNLFYEEGETSHNLETPLTVRRVRRVQPAGDDTAQPTLTTWETLLAPDPREALAELVAVGESSRAIVVSNYLDTLERENTTLRTQLAEANARTEKAEAMLVQRSDFWTDEHIEQFMEVVRKNLPDGTQVVVSHGYDELEGKVGTVLGAVHFIEQAAAKVSVDFGDGTEYVPSNLLRVVTSADSEHDSAEADERAEQLAFVLLEISEGYDYLHRYSTGKNGGGESLLGETWDNEGVMDFLRRVALAALRADSEHDSAQEAK